MDRPTAFISYSHSDKDFVSRIHDDLSKQGVEVWIDKFDIKPGDSIIQKIFSEGLAKAKVFLLVLSRTSTASKWVQQELDAAMIQKIEGVTRIIPLLKERCEIPLALRSLLYIDLSEEYEEGLRTLVKHMYGISDKPPIGKIPDYVSSLKQSVGGLSKEATTIGLLLLSKPEDQLGYDPQLSSQEMVKLLPALTAEEINDAVDELESYGLVKSHKVIGNAPFDFAYAAATYALFLHFKNDAVNYDPEDDIKQVAAAVVAKKELTGPDLQLIVEFSPGRINRAVAYLEEYGYLDVFRTLGTGPFEFSEITSTRRTREFVNANS